MGPAIARLTNLLNNILLIYLSLSLSLSLSLQSQSHHPPRHQHHTTSSKAVPRGAQRGTLFEQWLARGRGASMRSPEVAKITQSHTQPLNTNKGTPTVPLNSPTSTATREEHLTLHRKSKEPEGDLEGLGEGGEATCTKFTNTHTTKFIPEKGQLSTCGDAVTISLPLAKALSHTVVEGGEMSAGVMAQPLSHTHT